MESSFSYFVILDFEANCLENEIIRPQEIVEFPSVIVDAKNCKIVSEFQRYIRPQHTKLTEFCTKLTGITPDVVDQGTDFPSAVQEYKKWLKENGCMERNFILVTCGNWDLGTAFVEQCNLSHTPQYLSEQPFDEWINIKSLFCKLYRVPNSGGMASMMKQRGLEMKGRHHSGIQDCRNLATLFMQMIHDGLFDVKWKKNFIKRRQQHTPNESHS
jgi:inhibitor of KinA sporulation pathway (predicted exonuclease)